MFYIFQKPNTQLMKKDCLLKNPNDDRCQDNSQH